MRKELFLSKIRLGWNHYRPLRLSLRAKITIGIALPILIALSLTSISHYFREKQLLEAQVKLAAEDMGELALKSLRHAMLLNANAMLDQTIEDIGQLNNIQQIQIYDLQGQLRASKRISVDGEAIRSVDTGCEDCHSQSPRPRTVHLGPDKNLLRISTPIQNEHACVGCHAAKLTHLGVLLIDVSFAEINQQLLAGLRSDVLLSFTTTLLISAGVLALTHLLIVRRVEVFHDPVWAYSGGDFSARFAPKGRFIDELDELAMAFNQMADQLDREAKDKEERSRVRVLSIIEERQRLARELHDGVAQYLGYVINKASAGRLLLSRKKPLLADKQLQQIEEASQQLYEETREAILALKIPGGAEEGLVPGVKRFTEQFSRLTDLPIILDIDSDADRLRVPDEAEVQLMRIIQESLTNVRKHASATEARIVIGKTDDQIEIEISDNGVGFDAGEISGRELNHYGLVVMRERAGAIGADIRIDSSPGVGTRIRILYPLNGN